MKKAVLAVIFLVGTIVLQPGQVYAYNFGDFRSETLVSKAWQSLETGDLEGVLAYTNKAIELYAENAREMQETLDDFPAGSNEEVFAYWALNDIATAYYIQAEAYRNANQIDEATEAYAEVVNNYTYGQAYDTNNGSFWKPADAAKEKLAMISSGLNLDYGDYASNTLVSRSWAALADNDLDALVSYVNKTLELYAEEAKAMQESLDEYPWESNDKIFSYWALNDVGTGLFILGEGYRKAGKTVEAVETYRKVIDEYFYAQAWDPQGWFWKPAEAAQQKLVELGYE